MMSVKIFGVHLKLARAGARDDKSECPLTD